MNEGFKNSAGIIGHPKGNSVDWLHEGDNNTKFFHAVASSRRCTNRLARIQNEAGVWIDEPT